MTLILLITEKIMKILITVIMNTGSVTQAVCAKRLNAER